MYKDLDYNKRENTKFEKLTDSEAIIMKCVWDLGDGVRLAFIMDLANKKYDKNWKPQTVSTFLSKLVKKGFIEQYRYGRYYYYKILISKHAYRTRLIREEVLFWENGNVMNFCSNLLDDNTFSDEDKKELVLTIESIAKDEGIV
ncbi:MAG: BlaI/MecI/CopY family transcriptional regulator [Lachnospiraceae bacterium]|nr:BlaI/MecI/CopY family transcriptional regulator [Lachnospiraceae bacterium]